MEEARGTNRRIDGPPWLGVVRTRQRIDMEWLAVAVVMALSGLTFFGWRGMSASIITSMVALAGYMLVGVVLQTLRLRSSQESSLHVLTMGLILGLSMPAMRQVWVPVVVGLSLSVAMHVVGRTRAMRIPPVVLVLVLMWTLGVMSTGVADPESRLAPFGPLDSVLTRDKLVVGDSRSAPESFDRRQLWWYISNSEGESFDAVRRPEPGRLLLREKQRILLNNDYLKNLMVSGELTRLEDILIGAVPGSLGGSSRVLLIVLGLFLMHRRLAHWSVALWAVIAAMVTLWCMPVVIDGRVSLVILRLFQMSPGVGVAFTGYVLLATPLLLAVMVLSPMTAPISGIGRVVYGCLIGCVGVSAMWAFAIPQAIFLGPFVAGLMSRALDEFHLSPFAKTP